MRLTFRGWLVAGGTFGFLMGTFFPWEILPWAATMP